MSKWQSLLVLLASLQDWPPCLQSVCPVARNTTTDNWFLLDMRPHPGLLAVDPGIRITSLQYFLPPSRRAVTVSNAILRCLLSGCAALCSEAQSLSASLSSVDSASQKAPGASLFSHREKQEGLPSLSALPVPQVLEVFLPSTMALPLLNLPRPAPIPPFHIPLLNLPIPPFHMLGAGGGGKQQEVTSAQRSLST